MSNPGSDLSSEDELLTTLDYITIVTDDEDLSEEHQWHSRIFTPIISQLISECSLQNTIPLAGRTSLDW